MSHIIMYYLPDIGKGLHHGKKLAFMERPEIRAWHRMTRNTNAS